MNRRSAGRGEGVRGGNGVAIQGEARPRKKRKRRFGVAQKQVVGNLGSGVSVNAEDGKAKTPGRRKDPARTRRTSVRLCFMFVGRACHMTSTLRPASRSSRRLD